MNEKIEKVKAFAKEHETQLAKLGYYAVGCVVGYFIGKRVAMCTKDIALGAHAAIEYVKENGLEATEKMISECYKIK